MRHRGRLNLILLAAALLLLTLLLADRFRRSDAIEAPPVALTELTRDDVSRISIRQSGSADIELTRKGSDWHLRLPVQAEAEASEVAPLLRLATAPSHRQLNSSEIDLKRTGLETPQWEVVLNDHALELGDNSALGNQRYVRAGATIHLIDEPNTHALEPDYAHFIARRLLPEDARINAIRLPEYSIERGKDGALELTAGSAKATNSDLTHTVAAWKRARGLWISRSPTPPEQSLGEIGIELEDGSQRRYLIAARQPQLTLYSPELAVTYHVAAHQAAALLDMQHPESADETRRTLKNRPDVELPQALAL